MQDIKLKIILYWIYVTLGKSAYWHLEVDRGVVHVAQCNMSSSERLWLPYTYKVGLIGLNEKKWSHVNC